MVHYVWQGILEDYIIKIKSQDKMYHEGLHMIKSLDYENPRNFITSKIPCLTVQLMILSVQQNIKYPVDVQNVKMLGCIHDIQRNPIKYMLTLFLIWQYIKT